MELQLLSYVIQLKIITTFIFQKNKIFYFDPNNGLDS